MTVIYKLTALILLGHVIASTNSSINSLCDLTFLPMNTYILFLCLETKLLKIITVDDAQ